ncbi:MAG: cache domain-containing protein, partial [Desulfobulbaceae bacterium]|nr:cache domain-containing protein [Desulfobulbaceae bacterium]
SLDKMREDYIATRKQEVVQQINIHIDDIRFKISTVESQLRRELQSQTDNGWAIADNIYRHNKGSLPDDQIKKLIIQALMPLRFFHGRGYYWILDTDYNLVAHPFRPDFIGKSEADTIDRQGQKFIRNFIRVAQENEAGGFVSYFWNKPDVSDRLHIEKGEKKIAFLKLFKPFNWVIGTGEYTSDIEQEIQQEFLARLNSIPYGNKGYIFTHTYDGVCLSHADKSNIGVNRWDYQDDNGSKVVQQIIQTGRQPNGGFVEYMASVNPETGKPSPKISYVKAIDEWQWVLGAGVYLDDIDKTLTGFQKDLRDELRHRILATITIFFAALAVLYGISLLFSKRLTTELDRFLTFFKRAATHPETIDTSTITITELVQLGQAANQMVTERQHIQSDLQQAKEVWEKSFNAISDLVTIHDSDSRIIRANNAACNFLGIEPHEIIGKHCHDVFNHSEDRCTNCPAKKTMLDRHSHTATINFPTVGRTFQVSTAPTFDEQGRLEYIVHVAKDISEQKRLEEELIQSRKMEAIGTLAGGIAHDFNNILTSLLGYADLAEEEARDNGNQLHYIEQVIVAGNRASELVKQILTFSRKSEHTLVHISPALIIEEALKLLRAASPTTIKFQKEINITDDTIFADPTKIHQVVINLCTNALHAMTDQQGTLTVRLTRKELPQTELVNQAEIQPGPFMELSVTDTGHGIDQNIVEHIFDPYFTTKDVGKGIGMGLAVVHGIIKEHGGFIKVESNPLAGSTFYVYLPVSGHTSESETATHSTSLPTGNERIMVIDDENSICLMLKGGLERFGYQIITETSSTEALAEFTANPDNFDLVITDLTMPEISGLSLSEKILELRPTLPIILYSGYSEIASEEKIKAIGIRKFLLKPIDSRTMADHVRALLDESVTSTEPTQETTQ